MVKTSPSNARGVGFIPGQGAKIPHSSWPKNQNIKQKQYCNKCNKDFKKWGKKFPPTFACHKGFANAVSSCRNALLPTLTLLNSNSYLSFSTQVFLSSGKALSSLLQILFFHVLCFITSLSLKLHINFCDYLITFCLYLQTLKFMRARVVLIFAGTY